MWTDELIARLKKYVDASRYFRVTYRNHQVFGMDLLPEQYPVTQSEVYLEEYDDARPEGVIISDTEPNDFNVFLLKPVDWTQQDPNWNEADPETWEAFVDGK